MQNRSLWSITLQNDELLGTEKIHTAQKSPIILWQMRRVYIFLTTLLLSYFILQFFMSVAFTAALLLSTILQRQLFVVLLLFIFHFYDYIFIIPLFCCLYWLYCNFWHFFVVLLLFILHIPLLLLYLLYICCYISCCCTRTEGNGKEIYLTSRYLYGVYDFIYPLTRLPWNPTFDLCTRYPLVLGGQR